jgi:hypothetical protein
MGTLCSVLPLTWEHTVQSYLSHGNTLLCSVLPLPWEHSAIFSLTSPMGTLCSVLPLPWEHSVQSYLYHGNTLFSLTSPLGTLWYVQSYLSHGNTALFSLTSHTVQSYLSHCSVLPLPWEQTVQSYLSHGNTFLCSVLPLPWEHSDQSNLFHDHGNTMFSPTSPMGKLCPIIPLPYGNTLFSLISPMETLSSVYTSPMGTTLSADNVVLGKVGPITDTQKEASGLCLSISLSSPIATTMFSSVHSEYMGPCVLK